MEKNVKTKAYVTIHNLYKEFGAIFLGSEGGI